MFREMKNYVIYEIQGRASTGRTGRKTDSDRTGRWIYATGTLSGENVFETIENYRIIRFRLDLSLGGRLFETQSYHVFVAGELIDHGTGGKKKTIRVYAMYDSPDYSGIGIINLNGYARLLACDGTGRIPHSFIYLPQKQVKTQNGAETAITPVLSFDRPDRCIFHGWEDYNDLSSIQIILRDANGYDKGAPALFMNVYDITEEDGIQKKPQDGGSRKDILIFRGTQICRRV